MDELFEFVNTINETKKEYRREHAIIKDSEGEAFETNYAAYTDTSKKLNDSYKSVTDKLRGLKKQGKGQAGPRESNYDAAVVMQLHLGEKNFSVGLNMTFSLSKPLGSSMTVIGRNSMILMRLILKLLCLKIV